MTTRCKSKPLLLATSVACLLSCSNGFTVAEPPPPAPRPLHEVKTEVDYGLSLRTAALKLTGNLPTLAEIQFVKLAKDPSAALATRIDEYLKDPRFAVQQIAFWRNTFKMGESPVLDTAPTLAAKLVLEESPFTDIVTRTRGTCPTVDAGGKFTNKDCANGVEAVGVLSDPGMHSLFFGSMAFRRVRWVQETFLCSKFPAEISQRRETHPSGMYYSPWEFLSISGKRSTPPGRVNFHEDDKGELCANCHATLNHIAPLLGTFDAQGQFKAPSAGSYSVLTPSDGNPRSRYSDWLPTGEGSAWRYRQPTATLAALGAAIAADPGFADCLASRIWNDVLSRGDVVVDQTTLPPELLTELSNELRASKFNVKKLLRHVLLSSSFARY